MSSALSYREVTPNNLSPFDWLEVEVNTGTQHTLQDIKAADRAGGFTFSYENNPKNRNRFIYWRTYEDVLELSDISLDETLSKNRLRMRFPNTSVLALSITEHNEMINILVATGSSLHCFDFPLEPSDRNRNASNESVNKDAAFHLNEVPLYSIFHFVGSSINLNAPHTHYILGLGFGQHELPKTAACQLSKIGNEAIFSISYLNRLMLHVMSKDGRVKTAELKQPYLIPRFLTNLTGALIRKADPVDYVSSMLLCEIDKEHYVLTLYQSEELRLWSTTLMNVVGSISLYFNRDNLQGSGLNAMRKINETKYVIYISQFTCAEFYLVELQRNPDDPNKFNLVHTQTISTPDADVSDFAVSETHIWGLFNNNRGQYSVSSFGLKLDMSLDWVSAAMEPSQEDRFNIKIEQGANPTEAYISHIFHPGRFDPIVIKKSLMMFCNNSNINLDIKQLTMNSLRDEVCKAIHEEVRNELRVYSDEDALVASGRLWEHFYSCCEQYHYRHTEPCGIAIFESLDAVCIIRNQMFTLLRPCDMLEYVVLSGIRGIDLELAIRQYFPQDYSKGRDFINLLLLLAQMEEWIPEEIKSDIDKKLYQLETPADIVANLVEEILTTLGNSETQIFPTNILVMLRQNLHGIRKLNAAIEMLLELLRNVNFENDEVNQDFTELSTTSRKFISNGSLFGSEHGLSVLTETFKQNALLRFVLMRNLAILEQLILDTNIANLDGEGNLLPDTFLLMQIYYIIVWISETPLRLETPATLESSLQALSRVQLKTKASRLFIHYDKRLSSTTVLHMFLKTKGLHAALSKSVAAQNLEDKSTLNETLMPLINDYVYRLLWVLNKDFIFGEWLYNSGQNLITQNYDRFLKSWCEVNSYSRQYIVAVALLDSEEVHKAYELFLMAGHGVLKEKFLFETFLKKSKLYDELEYYFNANKNVAIENPKLHSRAVAYFYFKITQLFEEHHAYNYIIKMSEAALGLLDETDEYKPMFQSIIFNNFMILERYEDAYESLVRNVDVSRRKVGLRQLVLQLFTKKRLDLLMNYPYFGLHNEFERIVETRARTLSMEENDVYDFLYAYYVNNDNMRQAASIMYEQAMRLKLDYNAPKSLYRRISSLVICINALMLSDEKYRWIIKPSVADEITDKNTNDNQKANDYNMATTLTASEDNNMDIDIDNNGSYEENNAAGPRYDADVVKHDLESLKNYNDTESGLEIVDVEDIRRELYHAEALKQLAPYRKNIGKFNFASANDVAYLLATNNLFTSALRIAKAFKISLLPTFDSLTLACVRLSMAKKSSKKGWKWLQENDLKEIPHCRKPSQVAWLFLQSLLEEHELANETIIHKTVVQKLLNLNFPIPQWLHNSYKLRNSSQLLYLYVKHNRLFKAVDLGTEMLKAMVGVGSEYFNFPTYLGSLNPPMALPVRTLDLLLLRLRTNCNSHIQYKLALEELEDALGEYFKPLFRVSQDRKMEVALLENQIMHTD